MTKQREKIEIKDAPAEHPPEEEQKKRKKPAKKSPALKKLQKKVKHQEELLEETAAERDDFRDKYLRNLAEMDNFRKRVKKEKEEYQKYVLTEFLLDLLQVYDNLERALKAKTPAEKNEPVLKPMVSEDEKSIVSGVEMIYKQFTDLLKKHNVVEIDALNKPFDPNIHQALTKEETEDIEEPTVTEVYQKGFLYNDKLLKATLSKVAIPKTGDEENDSEDEEDDDDE